MQLDPKAAYTPEEILCIERAMQQWEASLKRPDLSERDRVRGAIEAYTRQAFALSALPSPEPTEAEVEALQDLLAEAAGVVKELLNGPMLGMSEPRRLTMADALNKAIPPANAALGLLAASRSRPAEEKAGMEIERIETAATAMARRVGMTYVPDPEKRAVFEAAIALEPVAEAKAEPVGYVTKEALKLMRSSKPGWHYHMFAKDQSDPEANVALFASPERKDQSNGNR